MCDCFRYISVKQPLCRPWGFQDIEDPRFRNNRHTKVTGNVVGPTHRPPLLISFRGWFDSRAIVRPEKFHIISMKQIYACDGMFWDCNTWTSRAVAWAKSREKFVVGSGISTFVKFPNTNAVFYLKQKGENKRRVQFVIRIPCFSWKTWLQSKEWPGNFSPAPWVVYLIEVRVTSMNVNLSLCLICSVTCS